MKRTSCSWFLRNPNTKPREDEEAMEARPVVDPYKKREVDQLVEETLHTKISSSSHRLAAHYLKFSQLYKEIGSNREALHYLHMYVSLKDRDAKVHRKNYNNNSVRAQNELNRISFQGLSLHRRTVSRDGQALRGCQVLSNVMLARRVCFVTQHSKNLLPPSQTQKFFDVRRHTDRFNGQIGRIASEATRLECRTTSLPIAGLSFGR